MPSAGLELLCEDTDVIRLLRWTYDLITGNPWLFWAAMATNAVGVVWGGWIWYGPMLAQAPIWAWLFIPDCPAAALWATIAFLLIRYGREQRWFTAFAAFGSIKYGLWTMAFWLQHWSIAGSVQPLELMLFVSHIGLTCEGLLLATRILPLSLPARLGVIGFYALSIYIDYGWGFFPPLTYAVSETFVFWLALGLTTMIGSGLLLLPGGILGNDPAVTPTGNKQRTTS
jgi:uncharacterized membrane protein YpjA